MKNGIFSEFNNLNQLSQVLNFLDQKYAFLFTKTEISKEKKEKVFEELKSYLNDDIENADDCRNFIRKNGAIKTLAPIDKDKRTEILEMFQDETKKMPAFQKVFQTDCNEYLSCIQEIKTLEERSMEGKSKKNIHRYIEHIIGKQLKGALNLKKNITTAEQNIVIDDMDSDGNEKDILLREEFIDPAIFFHTVQDVFRKYNYVLTATDIGRLKKVLKDMYDGRMVFLTGDTGSGKTELAILASELYLKQKGIKNKKATIIGGSRETDLSDFTLEKVISSENLMTKSEDDLVRSTRDHSTVSQKVLDVIIDKDVVKKDVKKQIEQGIYSDAEKQSLLQDIETMELDKYNIFTKYHGKGLFKAMYDGVPLIIDEMNAIRPEVLIGINHYLTRRVGEKITLPNGLGTFEIKDGFCIIATGNDKEANSYKEMYEGRYKLDESLINRMQTIEKGYMKQVDKQFSNDNLTNLDEKTDQLAYLEENEIYGVLLMLFFDTKRNKKGSLTTSTKNGFELLKEQFIGKSFKENKKLFFAELKKFAIFIKKLQDAFEKKHIVMCEEVDISTLINKRAFSMRNIRYIITDYQNDTKSLFYHIYNRYVSMGNGNDNELKGILYALKDTGLLPNNISGTMNLDGPALKEMKTHLSKYFIKEKNGGVRKSSLLGMHDKKIPINQEILDSKLILTKQDIYAEYFGKDLNNITDDDLLDSDYSAFQSETSKENDTDSENNAISISIEDLVDQTNVLKEILSTESNNKFLDGLSFDQTEILSQAVEYILSLNGEKLKKENINNIFSIFNSILNRITENTKVQTSDQDIFTKLTKTYND